MTADVIVQVGAEIEKEGGHIYLAPTVHTAGPSLQGI